MTLRCYYAHTASKTWQTSLTRSVKICGCLIVTASSKRNGPGIRPTSLWPYSRDACGAKGELPAAPDISFDRERWGRYDPGYLKREGKRRCSRPTFPPQDFGRARPFAIVESRRAGEQVRQQVIACSGFDELEASGQLERLV